jgi:4,5-dihydroxyphthalate decarboxylase
VAEPTVLRTVLADYPHTTPLKTGELTSESVRLDFHTVAPIHKAFAPMVREEAADLSELAIVTALQAIAHDRPVVLLPAVVASRFQRGCLIAAAARPVAPAELTGRRVGVRAFTQTTGMWVRAHLVEDYGLASREIHWVTRDGAHVAEYTDPPFVEHGIGDAGLPELLLAGQLDAVILGNDRPGGDEFVPVIPDAARRDREWWRQHGFMPINHMVAAGRTVARRDPAAVRAGFELLRAADAAVPRPDPDAPWPTLFGFDRLREPLEFVIETCLEQGLLPRRLTVDEVFAPAQDILGPAGA